MNAPDSARKPGPLLAVQDLTMRFGGLLAVDGVSLTVAPDGAGGSPEVRSSRSAWPM